ncbi:MAG: helix-turn-helix domain-containing protein [Prevotellaceae bacterium]|jgi:AraC-like DNA-binding protein|nr:helix-turn-helix domain-containing protein [Prevotellaceae bacterium]
MKQRILPFDWRAKLENVESYSIGNDFILLENPVITEVLNFPFKLDVMTAVICLKGTMKGSVNMQSYELQAPTVLVILPGQIVSAGMFTEDFSGLFIVMSRQFINDMNVNVKESLSLNLTLRQKPWIPLNEKGMNALVRYFDILKEAMRTTENPYRMEIVKHLTISFLYDLGFHFHLFTGKGENSKQEILVEKFLDLVQIHYKEQRKLGFYADKLCLTPKHLSKVIKEVSGTTANEWIDNHVTLEAKALLKSTNMTVQQISEELNFPSQSFFGKYFRRCSGMSPSEYKK